VNVISFRATERPIPGGGEKANHQIKSYAAWWLEKKSK